MQAKRVRCVCMLPHEFSLIGLHLHGFLTALPRPRHGLILSCLDALPRYRQYCLGLGLMKTASLTSLLKSYK